MKRKRKQLELTFISQSVKSEVRIAFCSVLFEIDLSFLSFSVQLLTQSQFITAYWWERTDLEVLVIYDRTVSAIVWTNSCEAWWCFKMILGREIGLREWLCIGLFLCLGCGLWAYNICKGNGFIPPKKKGFIVVFLSFFLFFLFFFLIHFFNFC